MSFFLLSPPAETAPNRRPSDQLALGGGQGLGSPSWPTCSPSAGGDRAVPLSGFCHMPWGRRCPASHPRDCANRPGRYGGGSTQRSRRAPRSPTAAQPQFVLAASGLRGQDGGRGQRAAVPLRQVQAPGECVLVLLPRGKRCKQSLKVGKRLCVRPSTEFEHILLVSAYVSCRGLRAARLETRLGW